MYSFVANTKTLLPVRRSKREYIFVGPPRCRKVHVEAVAIRYKYRFCIETTSPIQYYAIQDDSERYFDSGLRLENASYSYCPAADCNDRDWTINQSLYLLPSFCASKFDELKYLTEKSNSKTWNLYRTYVE